MRFTATQDLTSLTELLRFYSDVDEIVFKNHCRLDESEIAEACHDARRLAHRLKVHHGEKNAEKIAVSLGCVITREAWEVADNKIIYLAECSLQTKTCGATIKINAHATKLLADFQKLWTRESEQEFFTEAKISDVAIAHELFHLIEQRPPSTLVELEAHAFARAFTHLPFSPLLYNTLLQRLAKGKRVRLL
jgi:hypothetical protein